MKRTMAVVALLWAGCGGDDGSVEAGGDAAPLEIRTFDREESAWNAELSGLNAAAEWNDWVVLSHAAGLSVLDGEGVRELTDRPAADLASLPAVGVVVLDREGGLWVWDGELSPSPLGEAISGAVSLTVRRDELWVATASQVFRWRDGELSHLEVAAASIQGVRSADAVAAGESLLTPTDEGVEITSAGVPLFVTSGGVWGLFEAALYLLDDGAWTPLGLGDVTDVRVAPSGDAYAVRADGPMLIEGRQGWAIDAPGEWAVSDRAVWTVIDGELKRLGGAWELAARPDAGGEGEGEGEGEPPPPHDGEVTYTDDVAPFSEASCDRCHGPLGIARRLTTYDAWVANVDGAIDAIEAGRMPQDGGPLEGGDADLLRRWKDGGLIE